MRHGTTTGYVIHGCRCDECRTVFMRHDKRYRADVYANGLRYVDSTGTVRRLHALQALGWTAPLIAAESGVPEDRIVELRRSARRRVHRDHAVLISGAYEVLQGTPGPSEWMRAWARGRGYPPPLAWDCIDTDPKPHGDYPGALLTCVNGHRRDVYGVPRPDRNSYRCRACAAAREAARAAA